MLINPVAIGVRKTPTYDILYTARHQAQDVVACARTTSVRTEMRCYRDDAGVAAMLEAEFSDIERPVIPLITMLRLARGPFAWTARVSCQPKCRLPVLTRWLVELLTNSEVWVVQQRPF